MQKKVAVETKVWKIYCDICGKELVFKPYYGSMGGGIREEEEHKLDYEAGGKKYDFCKECFDKVVVAGVVMLKK